MNMKKYEIIDHTADIGIKAYGRDVKELFQNAAYGMFDIIADLEGIKPSIFIKIKKSSSNFEELLINWLDELLYNFYTKGIIFSKFDIKKLEPTGIEAEAHGKHIGDNRSRLKTEIKAVTYHGLKIEEKSGGYEVQIIFDV